MEDSIFSIIDEAGTIRELPTTQENIQKMMELLGRFTHMLSENDEDTIDSLKGPRGETILQKLCTKTLDEFVEALFSVGTREVNTRRANEVTLKNKFDYPVLKAALHGDVNTLKLLMENGANVANAISYKNETILHLILKRNKDGSENLKRWEECLKLLLGCTPLDDKIEENRNRQIRDIVNKRDETKNTALYYATHKWPSSIVLALLKHGAKVGMKKESESVIRRISPKTLEEFLDNHCLKSNFNTTENDIHIEHSDLEITFDYSFLVPYVEDYKTETDSSLHWYENYHLCCFNDPNND